MIRIVGIFVGLGFALVALISLIAGIGPAFATFAQYGSFVAPTAEHEFHLEAHGPEGGYSFDGPFGNWDYAQLQRGYQVYKQVCSACHSMDQLAFRNLAELGYSEAQVKAEAATWQVPGINPDTGESTMVAATPTDYFPSPFPNDVAAQAANGGKVPPDLSLITKARHHGSDYLYNLLTGYADPQTYTNAEGETLAEAFPDAMPGPGNYFNPYFPALNIGMAPPLVDGSVTYADGTEATVSQMSQDVAAFLTWTAEPSLVKRKQVGWPVLGFLLFATILAWFAKKQVWSGVKPKRRKD